MSRKQKKVIIISAVIIVIVAIYFTPTKFFQKSYWKSKFAKVEKSQNSNGNEVDDVNQTEQATDQISRAAINISEEEIDRVNAKERLKSIEYRDIKRNIFQKMEKEKTADYDDAEKQSNEETLPVPVIKGIFINNENSRKVILENGDIVAVGEKANGFTIFKINAGEVIVKDELENRIRLKIWEE